MIEKRHNPVEVLSGTGNTLTRKYIWGLDLAGLQGAAGLSPRGSADGGNLAGLHGAGGIGGLLAVQEVGGTYSGTYWYLYDANGNVGQVVNASGTSLVARYEYDPYGNAIVATGTYAAVNPFRFSTKWLDGESDLYYYGYRYYSPRMGRWVNRDFLEEAGGSNLYVFVQNRSTYSWDPHGLFEMCGSVPCDIYYPKPPPKEPPFVPPPRPPLIPAPPAPGVCYQVMEPPSGTQGPAVYKRIPCPPETPTCPLKNPGTCKLNDGWCLDDHYDRGKYTYHPGAWECNRSYNPPGQQCCYDKAGNLITTGPGAGSPDYVGPAEQEDDDGTCNWDYSWGVGGHIWWDVIWEDWLGW